MQKIFPGNEIKLIQAPLKMLKRFSIISDLNFSLSLYKIASTILCIFSFSFSGFSQYVVKGKIFVASNKEAMPFVPVVIKGVNAGSQSDFDGNFIIKTNTLGDSII